MKKLVNLKNVKTLSKNEQKSISGGFKDPWLDDGCGWPLCRNSFGRCSLFAC